MKAVGQVAKPVHDKIFMSAIVSIIELGSPEQQ